MMYVRFPLSLRNVEDLLFERGIDICHETVRLWWNRSCPWWCSSRLATGDLRLGLGCNIQPTEITDD
jgi:hypothetical protein